MNTENMYNLYYMEVYSFVMTLIKNRHTAEEITQKTFFRAMNTKKQFRQESGEFTWLCAIAKNLAMDELRAHKRLGTMEEETGDGTDFTQVLEDEDSMMRIHQVLHNLGEPYKEVFQLRIFGELSFRKIGLIFEKTENWARVTYHRARLMIQERMSEDEISM